MDRYKKLCNDIDQHICKFYRLGYEEYYTIWKNQIVGITPKFVGFYPLCVMTNWNEYKLNFNHVGDLIYESSFRQIGPMYSDIDNSPLDIFRKVNGGEPISHFYDKPLPENIDTFHSIKKRFVGEVNIATKRRKTEMILQN